MKWTKSQTGRLNNASRKMWRYGTCRGGGGNPKNSCITQHIDIRIKGFTNRTATLMIWLHTAEESYYNALKFSYKDSAVAIEIIELEQRVKYVWDTGTGISKDIQEQLFKNDSHTVVSGLHTRRVRDLACCFVTLPQETEEHFVSEEGKGSLSVLIFQPAITG